MSKQEYIQRRFGILEENSVADYGSITVNDVIPSVDTKNSIQRLIEKPFFSNLSSFTLIIYFIHALIQIEFRSYVSSAEMYFAVIDGLCLSIFLTIFSLVLYYHKLSMPLFTTFIDTVGFIATCVIYYFDISESVSSHSVGYKVCSILRFIMLLDKIKITTFKRSQRRLSVVPFKTNLERLLGLLNSLRSFDFIKAETTLDRELAWGINCICTQTLYNVEVQTENKEQEEVIKWAMSERPKWNFKSFMKKDMTVEAADLDLDPLIKDCLKKVDKLTFDVFKLKEVSNSNELVVLSGHLLSIFDVFQQEKISKRKFGSFIKAVQAGYRSELDYHNSTHASDVVQAFHYYLIGCGIKDSYNYSLSDYTICILSGSVHDYQHPGRTNAFLMNTKHELAVRYNDISVLENHHVASCFKLMYEGDSNFLDDMAVDRARKYRSQMIELVLATDFSKHFKELAKFKLRFSKQNEADKSKMGMLKMLMHAADVSNSTRVWETYYAWAQRVLKEYFSQGDEERSLGLSISPLCDRNTVSFAKSQIGFIDLFILPIFGFLSEIDQNFEDCAKNAEKNRDKLLAMSPDEDAEILSLLT